MLRQNEPGVLSGSEYFFNTVTAQKLNLFYSVSLCGHYYCDDQYCIDREYWDALLVILVEKGSIHLRYRDRDYVASAGDILLFDCAVPHRYTADPYAEASCITLHTPKRLPSSFEIWYASFPPIS